MAPELPALAAEIPAFLAELPAPDPGVPVKDAEAPGKERGIPRNESGRPGMKSGELGEESGDPGNGRGEDRSESGRPRIESGELGIEREELRIESGDHDGKDRDPSYTRGTEASMSAPEIKTIDMVRQIRDQHYEQLKGKSPEEVLEFYRREAAAVNAEVLLRRSARKYPVRERQ